MCCVSAVELFVVCVLWDYALNVYCMVDMFVWGIDMFVHRPQGRDHGGFLENDLGAEVLHHRHGDTMRGREQGKYMKTW